MILNIHEKIIKDFIEKQRPPAEIREQLDYTYSFDGTTLILYEVTPNWKNESEKTQLEYAKIRYYKSKKIWKLYWMRASGKWELYTPYPTSSKLEKLLSIISEDENACFFG